MKKSFLSLLFLVASALSTRAADALYHNLATVNCGDTPSIDALVFVNDGSFCAETLPGAIFGDNIALPWGTQNTLSFTNNGLMLSGRGFWLDNVTPDGFHHPAANIVNSAGGPNGPSTISGGTLLLLSATNVVNKGLLETAPSSLMQISGQNLNLARGGLLIDPASGGGACVLDRQLTTPLLTPTNFIPISGLVLDEYWGIGTVTNLASDRIVQRRGASTVVQSPFHAVTNNAGAFATSVGPLVSPLVFVRTNAPTPTNLNVQAIFVGSSFGRLDSNLTTQVKFVNNNYPENAPPNNGFNTAIVELGSVAQNAVTGQPIIYALYIVDQIATETNLTSLTNRANLTQRPATYIVDIYPPCSFFESATLPNATFTNTLIYNPTYSNTVVTATYAGYEAFLATATAGGVFSTNTPGRIEITGNNLDLTRTRVRAESIVSVKAPHLQGSTGLVVDAPNVNYDIGSTNGLLSVSGKDLANAQVQRFGGFVDLWSGLWTNQTGTVVTNIGPDPNDPSMIVTNLSTNIVEVDIHVLIVDALGITTTAPVFVTAFSANSTNIVLNDTLEDTGLFSLGGESLTQNGALIVDTSDWASTNVTLRSLTNNGTILVPSRLELGTEARPYKAMVNSSAGSLSSFSIGINADYVQDAGTISSSGFLSVNARTLKLEGGRVSAGNNLTIAARDMKMTGYQQSSAAFYLSVTNSINDTGVGANNTLTCNAGFNLLTKPAEGDLFGTTLATVPNQFAEASHIWAGEDRGATAAGFSDNVAIGRLVIDARDGNFLSFEGAGTDNALYADFLELRNAAQTDLTSLMAIDHNLVIYFADSNVAAQSLDGLFGGRLRWVSSFAGPNSSVPVLLLNGQTTVMNRALRFSVTMDTDGDGVPNAYDCYPLDAAAWNCGASTVNPTLAAEVLNVGGSRSVTISWSGLPSGLYQVEYTTSLVHPNWQLLANYTDIAVANGVVAIEANNIVSSDSQRYYRLRYGR
jgi:hypothetical protein